MSDYNFEENDVIGENTLSVISKADNFNNWMYQTIKPFCKGRIFEVGSGIGNISNYFMKDHYHIHLSDIRSGYCDNLENKFKNEPTFQGVSMLDLTDPFFDSKASNLINSFDTVFALNVVEHIEDDTLAISNCYKLLKPDGHLVILVPSYNALYNTFDEGLGHFRRYNKKSLKQLILTTRLKIIHQQYFNFIGIFGWYFSGKILKKESIPGGQMALYNKLVPFFKIIDKIIGNTMGLSTIIVSKKEYFNMKPTISVVMATYNGECFIKEAIQSILDQTFTDFEFIIVDDGSIDRTAEIVNSFKDDRIQYLKKEKNSGIADSLNLGISKAKGKYFLRMDDDDYCHKDRLYKQLEYLQTHSDVVVCATNDQNLGGNRPYLSDQEIRIGLLFRNVIIHASVMIPMWIFDSYKYNVEMVPSEDYDLWSRILKEGKFHKLSYPLMNIRYSSDGQTATRRHEQLKLNVSICKRFLKNYGFNLDKNDEYFLELFIEHDYSISVENLLRLLNWMDKLNHANKTLNIFSEKLFINEIEYQKQNLLKKYFLNRKLTKKIKPFIMLPFHYKLQVVNIYINKFF